MKALLPMSFILAVAVVAAACGGDDTVSPSSESTETSTSASSSGAGSAGGDGGTDGNHAVVTVGESTYEVSTSNALGPCSETGPYLVGSFAVDASGAPVQAGGGNVALQINFGIPPADWADQGVAPGSITVDDRTAGENWLAAEELGADDLVVGIETVSFDGRHVTGTARFVETIAFYGSGERLSVPGTFDITCGG